MAEESNEAIPGSFMKKGVDIEDPRLMTLYTWTQSYRTYKLDMTTKIDLNYARSSLCRISTLLDSNCAIWYGGD
jgi:hypothetical protein